MARTATPRASVGLRVHLLDVGDRPYGDCVLVQHGKTRVLIDGGHPGDELARQDGLESIPQQLDRILGPSRPFVVDLLVVTHAHVDHIGCLPALVKAGQLTAKHALVADPDLGWGRLADGLSPDALAPPEVLALAAALREESRADLTDDRELRRFLADAASLEDAYRAMISTLQAAGTKVVQYGRDSVDPIIKKFKSLGLEILGPSPEHLRLCAEKIRASSRIAAERAGSEIATDSAGDLVAAYRRLAIGGEENAPASDDSSAEADSGGRSGAAINNQSLVLKFAAGGASVLLSGDIQLARPGVGGLSEPMKALRAAISAKAPFDFVKLGHHGSDNALDETVLAELKASPLFGITTGRNDPAHPNSRVLALLSELNEFLSWVRTDRNGLVSLDWRGGKFEPKLGRGRINDPTPNIARDTPSPLGVLPAVTEARPWAVATRAADGSVEVVARVPASASRVTVSFDLQPSHDASPPLGVIIASAAATGPAVGHLGPFPVAPGRSIPRLLFVTNRDRLAENLKSPRLAGQILDSIARDHAVLDNLPVKNRDSAEAAGPIAEFLKTEGCRGVVILGGYDVVPSQRVDVLSPADRPKVEALWFKNVGSSELDQFYVWSDAIYGDLTGDGLADLPVSRIPDGRDPALIPAALASRGPSLEGRRSGIRNHYRPFAKDVFVAGSLPRLSGVPGSDHEMWVSKPHLYSTLPGPDPFAPHVYLMLHGDHARPEVFSGETDPLVLCDAFHLKNVPSSYTGVVFSGCCWGGLTIREPACKVAHGDPVTPLTPNESIPLAYLRAGAMSYVGCTGAHYSPRKLPDGSWDYASGEPIHRAFWRHYRLGSPPALALHEAKVDYAAGMPPYEKDEELQPKAIARKIFRLFTCLGLGW